MFLNLMTTLMTMFAIGTSFSVSAEDLGLKAKYKLKSATVGKEIANADQRNINCGESISPTIESVEGNSVLHLNSVKTFALKNANEPGEPNGSCRLGTERSVDVSKGGATILQIATEECDANVPASERLGSESEEIKIEGDLITYKVSTVVKRGGTWVVDETKQGYSCKWRAE